MSLKDIEIQALRTYIENLEKKNDAMGAILRGQIKFSVNVAKIIFKMDNLLEKKQKRIEELETKLSPVEEFSAKNDDLEDDLIDELVSTESIKYEAINTEEFLSENHADIVEDIEIDIIDGLHANVSNFIFKILFKILWSFSKFYQKYVMWGSFGAKLYVVGRLLADSDSLSYLAANEPLIDYI